ncbi:hypothetical protein Hanom_Chr16g01515981 [Helianthus anomalus]
MTFCCFGCGNDVVFAEAFGLCFSHERWQGVKCKICRERKGGEWVEERELGLLKAFI